MTSGLSCFVLNSYRPPDTTRRSCPLAMTFGHDDSTVNIVVVLSTEIPVSPGIQSQPLWGIS